MKSLKDELAERPPEARKVILEISESSRQRRDWTEDECLRDALDWWRELYATCPFPSWSEARAARHVLAYIAQLTEEMILERQRAYDRTFSRN